ncbi:MAG TPA: SH3 domain-containing protein, partial [Burkholderiaceae bacterium]
PATPARLPGAPVAPPRPDIPAPEVTPSAPAAPAPDSVIGGEKIERVQVTDPYIELHTGPGRGYPVFFVAARGEWIAITLRHTDWYRVTTSGGKQGWVNRGQLESTLTEAGGQQRFRDIALGDYLQRSFSIGAAYGRFHGDPFDKFWGAWRFSDTLSIESTFAQAQGVFSGTTLWHVGLQAEPWSDQRLSPFAGIGIGRFKNVPNRSLVTDLTTRSRLSEAIVGVNWHLGGRFVVRADYAIYTAFVSDERSTEYRAATLGMSVFF